MALRGRLLRDVAELQANPYPNILFTSKADDITTACLVLTTERQRLHLTVNFPENYPLIAPRITIQTPVKHPNVFGDWICASILNTDEEYTPAYDLKGICIQMLSFFASDSIESLHVDGFHFNLAEYQESPFSHMYSPLVGDSYNCPHCDFAQLPAVAPSTAPRQVPGFEKPQGSAQAKHRRHKKSSSSTPRSTPSSHSTLKQSAAKRQKVQLSDLPDEILAVICSHLETEELTPFAQAWDHIGGDGGVINRFDIIRSREMICFCFKKSTKGALLGVGVSVRKQGRIGSLESEFDLLSLEAFKDFGIRKSVQGLSFDHWLPLPITRRHYNSVKDLVAPRLQDLAQTAALPTSHPAGVVYAFMNDIVVRLCNQAESGYSKSSLVHASEKAIESYYHLFHLLLCLAAEDNNLRRSANQTIKSFLVEGKRGKTDVPNLGHLLVAVLISDADVTHDLLLAIIRETITRNVVWMLDKKGANMQELSYMEVDKISHYRLQKTFDASKTSYRLLMFLNLFRKTINRGTGNTRKTLVQLREELFDAHGAPPRGTAARLAGDIKALQNVKNFPEFITIMGLQPPPASHFTLFLRSCMEDSVKKGYSVWGITQTKALTLRQQVDPSVQIREVQNPEWNSRGGFNATFFPNLPNNKGDQGRSAQR